MIIPALHLAGGRAVRPGAPGGEPIAVGDPKRLIERLKIAGEVTVHDLDAAAGRGHQTELVEELLRRAPCRVGGGIHTAEAALSWLEKGALSVVVDGSTSPDWLRELPRDRVIAALEIGPGALEPAQAIQRMSELDRRVGSFLVTFLERQGTSRGVPVDEVLRMADAVGVHGRLTVAGGIAATAEIATLDHQGIDSQVATSVHTGALGLADAIAAPLRAGTADGLWPTVIANVHGMALGLAFSNIESLREAIHTGMGVYCTRSSHSLWLKGARTGAVQELQRVDIDCDRDALRFTVSQHGTGFCRERRHTCWGKQRGIAAVARQIAGRLHAAPPESYTPRLLDDPELLKRRLLEEANELADCRGREETTAEVADLLYYAFVAMARAGVHLADVERELDRRALRVSDWLRRSETTRSDDPA